MLLIDSHCHIDGEAFDEDRDAVVQRALDAGIQMMLTIGTGDPHAGEIARAVETAKQYEHVFAAVGVHPHDATLYNDAAENHLEELIRSSDKVIGWGEIGLDYYYDHSPRDIQREVFVRQIRKAAQLGLPIIIHSREADEDTVDILKSECSGSSFSGGIMHCFGGTASMAQQLMDIGFYISFAGNITFNKADNLREAARIVPLGKLLIETDAPFLTPVPHRGKRNEPKYVIQTAEYLADFYDTSVEVIAKHTAANFLRLFNLEGLELEVENEYIS